MPLVAVGTHCRGAIFLDGSKLETAELAAEIERICGSFAGFHFGRLDLKAPSLEHFRAGRSLRVLELNGVTSEATHIYDPTFSLLDAYRVLFRQWRLAFEIGAANQRLGAAVTPLRQLISLLRKELLSAEPAAAVSAASLEIP